MTDFLPTLFILYDIMFNDDFYSLQNIIEKNCQIFNFPK